MKPTCVGCLQLLRERGPFGADTHELMQVGGRNFPARMNELKLEHRIEWVEIRLRPGAHLYTLTKDVGGVPVGPDPRGTVQLHAAGDPEKKVIAVQYRFKVCERPGCTAPAWHGRPADDCARGHQVLWHAAFPTRWESEQHHRFIHSDTGRAAA